MTILTLLPETFGCAGPYHDITACIEPGPHRYRFDYANRRVISERVKLNPQHSLGLLRSEGWWQESPKSGENR